MPLFSYPVQLIKDVARSVRSRLKSSVSSLPERLTVTVGRKEIHFNTSSEIAKDWFYPRYREGRAHEEVIFDLLLDRLQPDSCFLDIGANVGFYSAVASSYCRKGSVHSFEMDPDLIGEIWKNLRANDARTAHVTCAAVWSDDGELLSFTPHITGHKSTNQVALRLQDQSTHVTSLTVDTYCKNCSLQPDIVKVDVEGAEFQVLKGMKSALSHVHTLFLEVHPSHLIADASLIEIQKLLQQFDFAVSQIHGHRRSGELRMKRLEALEYITENCMLLCEQSAC